MRSQPLKPFLWLSTLILIVSLACNIGAATQVATQAPPPTQPPADTPAPAVATAVPPTEAPTAAPQQDQPTAISSLGDVQKAVIQIEAEGTFIDPEVGWQVDVGKFGSGFIIDPSGIAVTNNHVVTGAGLLRVWVGGSTKPVNARVLGVSECSDLAVIDLEGDGYPYLEWYDQDITVGLKIFAAGFPLADPNYTLTDGIVSKAEADGETSWASVDSVIEHTAKINPGNSGGPLVTENGKLVGVNYAVVSSTDQNYAIARDEARPILNELRSGKNVDSVGVNGGAVYGEINGSPIYGVWVRSVLSGSPADKARIKAGDIIWEMEGKSMAQDGTMADYCDVLRSHSASDTMSFTIIRFSESDMPIMEGQLNGREVTYSGYAFGGTDPGTDPQGDPDGVLELVDDTGTVYVEVPGDWVDTYSGPWNFGGDNIGISIEAAPNLQDFRDYYSATGMFFGASAEFAQIGGYVQFLDYYVGNVYSETVFDYRGNCSLDGRYNYNDGLYQGKYDAYYNCGGAGGSDAYVLSAVSIENQGAYIIIIIIQVPKGEIDDVNVIWNSFLVGDL